MGSVITVILVALSTYRTTKLITGDRITAPIRDRIQLWFEDRWLKKQPEESRWEYVNSEEWHSMGAYFLSCPWCVSFWVAGLITLGTALFVSVPLPVLVWLTASGITGFLASKED